MLGPILKPKNQNFNEMVGLKVHGNLKSRWLGVWGRLMPQAGYKGRALLGVQGAKNLTL